MKEQIIEYIKTQFGSKTSHFSYCSFPETECSCRNLEDIDENTNLITGGYIDSFSIVNIVVWIERTFDIKIPEKLVTTDNFDTINKIVETINDKLPYDR